MKKGCLTAILVFFAICLLFGMCSTDTPTETHNNTETTTLSLPEDSVAESALSDSFNDVDTSATTILNEEHGETEKIEEATHSSTTTPPHIHSFGNATCTSPKTCSCGATEGSANGHNWKDATCSDPKTCTICGTTSGLTAGHTFSEGACTSCGKADPDYVRETMVWIPTKGGTKYHTHAGCSNMDDPEQVTQSEAEALGFTPCKRCH